MQLDLPMVAQTLDYTCGAACFDSMRRYFNEFSLDEMHYANELGTLHLGYTPPANIVRLAKEYGFQCDMKLGASLGDLIGALQGDKVIFVTWWDEDAGHYSLVKDIDSDSIFLMDPWTARAGADNCLSLESFNSNWNMRGAVAIFVSRSRCSR